MVCLELLQALGPDDVCITYSSSTSNTDNSIRFGVTQPTTYFIGREEEQHQLAELFLSRCPPVAVISGIGGQGKTELCRQFIKTLKARDSPPSVIWLRGDTTNNLTTSITQLSLDLEIPVTNDERPVQLKELIISLSDKISDNGINGWLLVIDDVNEMYLEFLQAVHISISHGAFVLITSRRIDILSGEARQMPLNVLKEEDAHSLSDSLLAQPSNEDVGALCRELGNHALSLRQAISYISAQRNENKSSYGIRDYLDELAKDKTLLGSKVNFIDGYDQTIYFIVTRTLQTIHQSYGWTGHLAVEIVQILCLARPTGISAQCLQKIVEATQISDVDSEIQWHSLKKELHQVLLLLKKYSLISYDGENFISIHPLIQKVAKTNSSHYIRLILNGINLKYTFSEELRQLINIWEHADPDTIQEFSNFPIRIFNKMLDLSMLLEMKSFAEKNHLLLSQLLGPDHNQSIEMEVCVAIALLENEDNDAALIKYKEVFEKEKRFFTKNRAETLLTASHIAIVLTRLGRFEESLEWYEQMLESQIKLVGNETEHSMTIRHNMASVLDKVGRLEEALRLSHEVLEWRTTNLGATHASTLFTRHNIGVLLFQQGRLDEAKIELEIVLSCKEKALGTEHASTLISRDRLAACLWKFGTKEEAIAMMTEVLHVREKVLGIKHPDTQLSRKTIAKWEVTM